MTTHRRSLAAQGIALGFAVPQVLAYRAARMGDHAEVLRMGSEKVFAFNEAWVAMATQAFLENQKLALSFFMQPVWSPWGAGMSILGAGMAPYRRRAVANARRLATSSARRSSASPARRRHRSGTAPGRA